MQPDSARLGGRPQTSPRQKAQNLTIVDAQNHEIRFYIHSPLLKKGAYMCNTVAES